MNDIDENYEQAVSDKKPEFENCESFDKGDVVEFCLEEGNNKKGYGIIVRCIGSNFYNILTDGKFNNYRRHVSAITQISDLNIFDILKGNNTLKASHEKLVEWLIEERLPNFCTGTECGCFERVEEARKKERLILRKEIEQALVEAKEIEVNDKTQRIS